MRLQLPLGCHHRSMAQLGAVEQYWTGVASQLQVEAEVFNRLVGHNGEMGRANEIALVQLVTRLLPARFGVGTGLVIDSRGRRSRQCDLIVYDAASQPQILAHSTQLLFPIETVRLALEVKTTVSSEAIEDVAEKAEAFRRLTPSSGSIPPFALFGYQANGAPAVRARELNGLADARRPNLACILVPGIVTDPSDPSRVGLVPLHTLGANGERVTDSWMAATGTSAWTVHAGTRHPVSRFSANAAERYVFEPGRALMLFVTQLIGVLQDDTSDLWLENYFPAIARQVVVPSA